MAEASLSASVLSPADCEKTCFTTNEKFPDDINSRSTIDQKQRKDSTENPKKHMKLDRVYSTHHNVGDSYGCTE